MTCSRRGGFVPRVKKLMRMLSRKAGVLVERTWYLKREALKRDLLKAKEDLSKTEAARKALAHYRPWWRAHRNPAFVPWQTAAWAEAYLLRAFLQYNAAFEIVMWPNLVLGYDNESRAERFPHVHNRGASIYLRRKG